MMNQLRFFLSRRLQKIRLAYLVGNISILLAAFLFWRVPRATAVAQQSLLDTTTLENSCPNTDDVLVLDRNTGRLSVSYGGTTALNTLRVDPDRTWMNYYLIGDFNGDGISDIFTVDQNTGQWFVSYSGTSNYQQLGSGPASNNFGGIKFGHFDSPQCYTYLPVVVSAAE